MSHNCRHIILIAADFFKSPHAVRMQPAELNPYVGIFVLYFVELLLKNETRMTLDIMPHTRKSCARSSWSYQIILNWNRHSTQYFLSLTKFEAKIGNLTLFPFPLYVYNSNNSNKTIHEHFVPGSNFALPIRTTFFPSLFSSRT